MNYYMEMIHDFVMSEMNKPHGILLDDGEFVYACGLAFQMMMAREKKRTAEKKEQILVQISTFHLLKVEIQALMKEYETQSATEDEQRLCRLINNYQPKAEFLDSVMLKVMEKALAVKQPNRRYERQERYQKKVGLVSKTYKLNGQVVDEFAQVCKENGVPLGPTLTELMQAYIQQYNKNK